MVVGGAGAFLLYHLQLAERKLSNQNYLFEWGMIIISDVVETALGQGHLNGY